MAGSTSALKADIQAIMDNLPMPADPDSPADLAGVTHDIAALWAAAYKNFASGFVSCQGRPPTGLGTAETVLAAALEATFAANGTPASTASNIATAFTAFWLTPPITFVGGPTPGLVTAVAGTALLQAALIAAWVNNLATTASNSDAAQSMADALAAFTLTVVATHAPPSPCAAPLA